jgi:hypothetical protein
MRIDLRRDQVGMPQQLLNTSQIRSRVQ